MKKLICNYAFACFILLLNSYSIRAQSNNLATSKIENINVYLKGAQIYRSCEVVLNPGSNIVRCVNLSPYIDASSIQIKVDEDITVQSIQFERNYLNKVNKSDSVHLFQNYINQLNDTLEVNKLTLNRINEDILFLKNHAKLSDKYSVADIKLMAQFISKQMDELKLQEWRIGKENLRIQNTISVYSKQVSEWGKVNDLPTGEIKFYLESKIKASKKISFSYFTKEASWLPVYDVRAQNINSPLSIQYKARLKQDTKENWENVNITLSSETPTNNKNHIPLKPYFINYGTLPPQYNIVSNFIKGVVADINGDPLIGAYVQYEGTSIGTTTDIDGIFSLPVIQGKKTNLIVNYAGFQEKIIPISSKFIGITMEEAGLLDEVVLVGGKAAGVSDKVKENKKEFNVHDAISEAEIVQLLSGYTYNLKSPVSLLSGENNKILEIGSYIVNADYKFISTPKISSDVYINAIIKNWTIEGLLDGEANIYYEDNYIGKSVFNLNADVDSIYISLGVDNQLRVERIKEKDSYNKRFLSGKKTTTRSWKIVASNNKTYPIVIDIFDQIPVSTENEIEVEFKNESKANWDKASGIISWNKSLAAKSKETIFFQYAVKHPEDKKLIIE